MTTRPDRPDKMAMASAERRDLADLLETLTPAEWEAPTLCPAWNVREVVAHLLSYEELDVGGIAASFLRGGLRLDRINKLRLAAYAGHTPAQVLELLHRSIEPRGLTRGFGGGIALADGMIHQQDIRRPLGRPREIPAERLEQALAIALTAPTLPARKLARRLRLVATDLDWATGAGPEVTGPAESILMTIAGRASALPELSGAGVATLGDRLG